MSFDCSRLSFHPWNDYFGVIMEQGRVQLDADWNEWVAQVGRRLQAGTMDGASRAFVPKTTPNGFRILASGGTLSIGPGRMYVDGLQVENHGALPVQWDTALAEMAGTADLPFFEQPYCPFNPTNQTGPAAVFNRPVLSGGPHLVYLDVWQRELTYLQEPKLIETAVGIPTTARMQTVWRVGLLTNIGNATCSTADEDLPGWADKIRPSGARLSNDTGDVPGDPNPCLTPPAAGYKGLENQLYRVEIHRGGPQATATFKWSRDNVTVAHRVLEIHDRNRLVVDSIGRDEVLGFRAGDWIEVLDDWHELHARPGQLRRIRLGDGVDSATRSILLDDLLPDGLFPVDAQGFTAEARHTRIRRWDQSDVVRRADGSILQDLSASATSEGIPLPPAGTQVALENGILVAFALEGGGMFEPGQHWVFAARVADASIEPLVNAPPRGIHHHYARLAIVTFPDLETDCRVKWPPADTAQGCDCTVCVSPEEHNGGTVTIQNAIDRIRARGGGTICLDAGDYRLEAPLNLEGARSLRIRGQGWRTLLRATVTGTLVNIERAFGVTVENLSVLGVSGSGPRSALIRASTTVDLNLTHLAIVAMTSDQATASAAIGLSGLILKAAIRECTLVADVGISTSAGEEQQSYLLTSSINISDNAFLCRQRGLSLGGICIHHGELRVAGNLLVGCADAAIAATGGALPTASVSLAGNVMHITGDGVRAGTDKLRVTDNEIVCSATREKIANGIVLEEGLDKGGIDHAYITGNRMLAFTGDAIAVRHALGQAMIKSNVVEGARLAGLSMVGDARADYICIENNHFSRLGAGFDDERLPHFGVQLTAAARADVTGNVFSAIARDARQNPLRAAIFVQASSDLRIAGNRLFGIGPSRSLGKTIAIAVNTPFRQLAIEDNAAARLGDATDDPQPAEWFAIWVAPFATERPPVPGTMIVPMAQAWLFLSASRIGRLQLTSSSVSVSVRGNRLRGDAVRTPLVQIEKVQACLFLDNDCEARFAENRPHTVVIDCGREVGHINASNNRIVFPGEYPAVALEARQFAVLGNITSGHIMVNTVRLPDPWYPLNVRV